MVMNRPGPLTLGAVSLGLLLPLLLLKLHVSEVQEGTHNLIAGALLVHTEAQDVHGMLRWGWQDQRCLGSSRVQLSSGHCNCSLISTQRHRAPRCRHPLCSHPTYVSGHELLPIIHVVHGDDTLAAEVVVIGVHRQKQHVWGTQAKRVGPAVLTWLSSYPIPDWWVWGQPCRRV